MARFRDAAPFERADAYEWQLCQNAMDWATRYRIKPLFRVASRLGDGVFWYSLILLIALFDLNLALLLASTGLVATILYKILKHWLIRERPFIRYPSISPDARVLDRYSFPSGHTLHAVCFTVMLLAVLPWVGLVILPLTVAIALSRVTLGLHYPSDVAAGAMIGALLGMTSLSLMS